MGTLFGDLGSQPTDLPGPGEAFTCPHCEEQRPVGEFAKTTRGYEILDEFHAG